MRLSLYYDFVNMRSVKNTLAFGLIYAYTHDRRARTRFILILLILVLFYIIMYSKGGLCMKISFECDVETLKKLDEMIEIFYMENNIRLSRSEMLRSCIRHYYLTE